MSKPKERLPIYSSMKAMAGATGIPLEWLKDSKNKGCPAFRQNNSVSLGEWLKWFGAQDQGDDDVGDALKWSEKYSRVKTWIAEIELSKKRGEVVDRKVHLDALAGGFTVFRGEHHQLYCQEFPARAKGFTELEMQSLAEQFEIRLFKQFREKAGLLQDEPEAEKTEEVKPEETNGD